MRCGRPVPENQRARLTSRASAAALSLVLAALLLMVGAGGGSAASGHTFYVSPGGSDTQAGTTVLTAFQHIQACARVMTMGDTCSIMSGTYRETIVPANSGMPGAPITYRAGPGADVEINGTDPVSSGWTRVTPGDAGLTAMARTDPYLIPSPFYAAVTAGRVWKTSVRLPNLSTDSTLLGDDQIFVDRQMMVQAQWPDPGSDLLKPAVEFAPSVTYSTTNVPTIRDPQLAEPAGYWCGARVLISSWFVTQTDDVMSPKGGAARCEGSIPGAVTLDAPLACVSQPTATGVRLRYSLFGRIEQLSGSGQWFYSPPSQALYLIDRNADDPDRHLVEVKQRTRAFDLRGIGYTTVSNLNLFGSTIQTDQNSSGDLLEGLEVLYPSHYSDLTPPPRGDSCLVLGIGQNTSGLVLNGTNNTVLHSTIAYSAGSGIALLGAGNSAIDNIIHDVDYMATFAGGVSVRGSSQTVLHNTIFRTGRSGVFWQPPGPTTPSGPASGDLIAYNDLSDYDRLNLDGGAVYTGDGSGQDEPVTRLDHNWVHDWQNAYSLGPEQSKAEAGIYLDSGSNHVLLYDNVGWGNPSDTVFLNPTAQSLTHDISVFNNDGGVEVCQTSGGHTQVVNGIGDVTELRACGTGPTGVPPANNLPSNVDPRYADEARHDYHLRPDSPARNAGYPIQGVTEGSTDPTPSLGAYQYGGPHWRPGARCGELHILLEGMCLRPAPAFSGLRPL